MEKRVRPGWGARDGEPIDDDLLNLKVFVQAWSQASHGHVQGHLELGLMISIVATVQGSFHRIDCLCGHKATTADVLVRLSRASNTGACQTLQRSCVRFRISQQHSNMVSIIINR